MFKMYNWLSILLVFSFVFLQEPCEGTCLSEEETNNLFNNIQECEFNLDKTLKLNGNLDEQLKLYLEQHANDSLLVLLNEQKSLLLNDKIKLYDDLVKQVKPKWYENKWLWFTIGVVTTAGTLKLASELVD